MEKVVGTACFYGAGFYSNLFIIHIEQNAQILSIQLNNFLHIYLYVTTIEIKI